MINQELLDYIKQQLNQRVSKDEIKNKLLANGWLESDINEAFALISSSLPTSPQTEQSFIPPSPSFSEGHFEQKPKSNLVKIIIGVFIVLLLGAGVSLVTRILDPFWNPFRPKPEEVIARMASKMESLNYLHSETKIEISGQEDGQKNFSLLINYTTDSDNSDSQSPKMIANFNIAGSADGMQLTVGGETRTIGDVSYFKLTTLPVIPGPINLNKIKNQWFKIDAEFGQELLNVVSENLPLEQQLIYQQILEVQMEAQKEMQNKMEEKFEKLLTDRNLYLVKQKLPDGKIGNQKVYGYLIALNREKIKEIFLETVEIYMEIYFEKMFSLLSDPTRLPASVRPSPTEIAQMERETERTKKEGMEEIRRNIDEFLEKIGEIEGEIWIGKKDFYLYKVNMGKEIDIEKIQPLLGEGRILIKIDMNFSNFDKPVKIEPPAQYKDFEEVLIPLLREMIEASIGKARLVAKDTRIITNMNQFRPMAEIYYGNQKPSSYINFCTSRDAAFLKKDIIDQGGVNFNCYVQSGTGAGKSYCIEVKLNSGEWWCIDSSGRSKQYTTNPSCAACIGKICRCE